jgi:hypothetical protein
MTATCPCCHGTAWIDGDTPSCVTALVCVDPDAHTRQPRLALAGNTAYECPHCAEPDDTLEFRPVPTPDQVDTIIDFARQVTAPIYHRGVHRAALRRLRARLVCDDIAWHQAHDKELPNA